MKVGEAPRGPVESRPDLTQRQIEELIRLGKPESGRPTGEAGAPRSRPIPEGEAAVETEQRAGKPQGEAIPGSGWENLEDLIRIEEILSPPSPPETPLGEPETPAGLPPGGDREQPPTGAGEAAPESGRGEAGLDSSRLEGEWKTPRSRPGRPTLGRGEAPAPEAIPEGNRGRPAIPEGEQPVRIPDLPPEGGKKSAPPRIWFTCPPFKRVSPCQRFKIIVRFEDAPGGPGLDLDSLQIQPAQPLGGGAQAGGADAWTNIRDFFRVFPDRAILCVPRSLWFPSGPVKLVARIANLDRQEAKAEIVFCVQPRRVPLLAEPFSTG